MSPGRGDDTPARTQLAPARAGERASSIRVAGTVAATRALTCPRVLDASSPRALCDRQSFAINHSIDTSHLRELLARSLTG
ncbi:hypothetical protein [Pseudactinotalea sp. HY158]|uniref:hypothetical protein n=1 Tax=Pseudactinotalea sp. HY158 TaxID=2654547 RepID=UPI00129CAD7A|nr:hypothetical protein [Pseudactinotalea sp. HY158]QGH70772.1 hypothetical protein GCE65_15670 [Pseudactinotalea sp. HY158]